MAATKAAGAAARRPGYAPWWAGFDGGATAGSQLNIWQWESD